MTASPNMSATPRPKPATHFHVYPLAPGIGVPCSCTASDPKPPISETGERRG